MSELKNVSSKDNLPYYDGFEEDIAFMNTIAGKVPVHLLSDNLEVLDNLSLGEKLIIEEAEETLRAIINDDLIEIVDGVADVSVVAAGFNFLVKEYTANQNINIAFYFRTVYERCASIYNLAGCYFKQKGIEPNKAADGICVAIKLVMENNLLKFTKNYELALEWLHLSNIPNVIIKPTEINGEVWYCLMDENGKFRKWEGFPKVNLQPVIDQYFTVD